MDIIPAANLEPGYAPDMDGNPVLMECFNCQHISDQSDGPEYGHLGISARRSRT